MFFQTEVVLSPKSRGIHLITDEIVPHIPNYKVGIANIFLKHTSAALAINENADYSVRVDVDYFLDKFIPDGFSGFTHTLEGADDMPAHLKSLFFGINLTIPITNGRLNLGTWQGIYLCEFRDYGGSRHIVITANGEY